MDFCGVQERSEGMGNRWFVVLGCCLRGGGVGSSSRVKGYDESKGLTVL